MTSFKTSIERLHQEALDGMCDPLIALQDTTLALIEGYVHRLQEGLAVGSKIVQQDGEWHLFKANGDSVVSAEDLYSLIIRVGELP